jgi:cytochrome c5
MGGTVHARIKEGVPVREGAAMRDARILAFAALAGAALCLPAPAGAARDGQQVYAETCSVCHATGRDGAPRVGDKKAWAQRAERGLSGLTQTALIGLRKMPPHGGKLDTTDLELKRAIAYMVNQSGGKWIEPIDRAQAPAKRSGESIVQARCRDCHASGKGGAPMIGDQAAWVGRAKDGLDSLVQSAIRGHGGMPARGGMADLTDAEMRDAVVWMYQASVKKPR